MSIGVGSIASLAVTEGYRAAAVVTGEILLDHGVIALAGNDIAGSVTIIGDYQWVMGSVTLTTGSAVVAGVDTRWGNGEIDPGQLFICRHAASGQSMVVYQVQTVGGAESITLTAPWRGEALEGAPYLIHRKLSARGIPLMQRGDVAIAALYTYSMIALDHLISSG